MNKRIKKQFWLSPEDAEKLKHKAELSGLSETAVIRLLIRGYEPKKKTEKQRKTKIKALVFWSA